MLRDATRPGAQAYRGRFAPSPTGPLHFGSLLAAVGSFLDARHHDGIWVVRMEDIDRNREVAGAADHILSTLDAFGLHWDGAVVYQSQRTDAYSEALDRLRRLGMTYPCSCSRKDVATIARHGVEGPIYPGTCRSGLAAGRRARSIRLRVPPGNIAFSDRVQGPCHQDIGSEIGDFVLHRADGFHAYQLAVVLDDADAGITDVVRGADLCISTPRQILLQRILGLPTPSYAHLPLALDEQGRKLSKSTQAAPVDPADPIPGLCMTLRFLGQDLPTAPLETIADFWRYAIPTWDPSRIPAMAARPFSEVTPQI